MPREVRIDAAQGIVVLGWRSAEDGLFLRVRGQPEDVRLVCHCSRSHWVVHENFPGGRAFLAVRCHSCGQRGTFALEGVSLPAP